MPTDPKAQAEAQLRRIEEVTGQDGFRRGRRGRAPGRRAPFGGRRVPQGHTRSHPWERQPAGPRGARTARGWTSGVGRPVGHSVLRPQGGAAPGLPSACGSCRELGARCDESGPENRRELPQEEAVCAYPSALSKALTAGTEPSAQHLTTPESLRRAACARTASNLTSPDEVDADIAAWVRAAYDRAG